MSSFLIFCDKGRRPYSPCHEYRRWAEKILNSPIISARRGTHHFSCATTQGGGGVFLWGKQFVCGEVMEVFHRARCKKVWEAKWRRRQTNNDYFLFTRRHLPLITTNELLCTSSFICDDQQSCRDVSGEYLQCGKGTKRKTEGLELLMRWKKLLFFGNMFSQYAS